MADTLWIAAAIALVAARLAGLVLIAGGVVRVRVVVGLDAVILLGILLVGDPRSLLSLAVPIVLVLLLLWVPASRVSASGSRGGRALLLATAFVTVIIQAGVAHAFLVQAAAARSDGQICLPPGEHEAPGYCDLPPH